TGILPMTEPETRLTLEAPGGPVGVRARCRDGRVEAVTLSALPSFVHRLDAALDVPGLGTIRADVAYGGDSFALVDAAALGFALEPGEARAIAELGARIAAAATERIGFAHPENPDWRHVSFCLFQGPLARGADGGLSARQAVAIRPGKIDRSPCGTGCAARMAAMAARGEMGPGDRFSATSLIGSRFDCAIAGAARVGDTPAIAPEITGRAWITGARQLMLDPHDPWPHGYRLGDTWPGAGAD
ncbi:MAG: proline racemase family protein, partial [Pseudomonadota bacterium]